jgi:hypothetical protein
MNTKWILLSSLILLIATACLSMIVIEWQAKIIRRTFDTLLWDNCNHYLPCNKLPSEEEVRAIVRAHEDIIQAIEAVNPGNAGVEIDAWTCPGRADLVIWYASRQNRLEIETILGQETFFGVPYRLQNR